jgi:hypothetical protein
MLASSDRPIQDLLDESITEGNIRLTYGLLGSLSSMIFRMKNLSVNDSFIPLEKHILHFLSKVERKAKEDYDYANFQGQLTVLLKFVRISIDTGINSKSRDLGLTDMSQRILSIVSEDVSKEIKDKDLAARMGISLEDLNEHLVTMEYADLLRVTSAGDIVLYSLGLKAHHVIDIKSI